MAVMTVQAQSICATWRSMQPVVETDEDGSFTAQNLTYTFSEDGSYYYVNEYTLSTKPSQTMALEIATTIELRGTYTLEGDKLTLTPNMDTFSAELLSTSVNGKVTEDANVKNYVNSMITSDAVKSQFAEVQHFTFTVNDTMLQMNDGEETISYMRFATIQN